MTLGPGSSTALAPSPRRPARSIPPLRAPLLRHPRIPAATPSLPVARLRTGHGRHRHPPPRRGQSTGPFHGMPRTRSQNSLQPRKQRAAMANRTRFKSPALPVCPLTSTPSPSRGPPHRHPQNQSCLVSRPPLGSSRITLHVPFATRNSPLSLLQSALTKSQGMGQPCQSCTPVNFRPILSQLDLS